MVVEHRDVPRHAVPPLRRRARPRRARSRPGGRRSGPADRRDRRAGSGRSPARRARRHREGRPVPHRLGRALGHGALWRREPPVRRRCGRPSGWWRPVPPLVGIDSVNIDDTRTGERPIHSILLAAGIPIVEHLCRLDQLTGRPFTVLRRAAGGVRDGDLPGPRRCRRRMRRLDGRARRGASGAE